MEHLKLGKIGLKFFVASTAITTLPIIIGAISLYQIATISETFENNPIVTVQNLNLSSYLIAILTSLNILVSILISLFILRRTSIKLHNLSSAAEQVEKSGDLSIPIKIEDKDEIGGLASILNRLRSLLSSTQQALEDSSARNQAILNTAVDAIITIDENGIIEFINPAAEHIFGYTKNELLGQNVKLLMPEPDSSNHDRYIKNYLQTGENKIIGIGREVVALHKNGSLFPADLAVSQVDLEDRKVFTGIVRDISERKKFEAQLIEKESLAKLGELSAIVAHEVKNPLAAIIAGTRLLKRRLSDDSQESNICSEIMRRTNSLSETVKKILLYSKPKKLDKQKIAIKKILENCIALIVDDPIFNSITIQQKLPDQTLLCDSNMLEACFINILQNSAQAMKGRGQIFIEGKILNNNVVDHIEIKITDSGPGIPEADIDQVFNAFFSTESNGTGLGLPIVKRLIELHGGSVSISCRKESGTTVAINLPIM